MNASVHPSRRPSVLSTSSQAGKRKKAAKSSLKSASGLRTKVRDITRQLARAETMPANIRVNKERELAGYKGDLEQLEEQNHRKKIIGKYHMVRFFERQKATRALKRLQKAAAALPPASPERGEMREAVHEAEVDRNYTIYCPLAERYHGLYPRQTGQPKDEPDDEFSGDEAKPKTARGAKPAMWNAVERAMADGDLEALRDGRLRSRAAAAKPRARREKLTTNQQHPSRKAESTRTSGGHKAAPDDDAGGTISDGGFFEE